jgi:Ca-activated chloride channel family protein
MVQPVEIIGREGRIMGQRIELFMNQLYGDQQKYALVKVRLPAAREGDRLTIARAEVHYQDPLTRQPESSRGTSLVSFSHDPVQVEKSANRDVVREYQLNLKALAQEKAIELSDEGRQPEAVTALKQSAERLKQVGRLYDDSELLKEAEAVEAQADQIEEKGMSKKSRKVLRTQSYQQKNQQLSQ